MTIWMGSKPNIFITDIGLAKELFNRKEFSGRTDGFLRNTLNQYLLNTQMSSILGEIFSNDKHKNIVLTDFGPVLKALRTLTLKEVK